MQAMPPPTSCDLTRDVTTLRHHVVFIIWCTLTVLGVLIAGGLQSRYAWPVATADVIYLCATMIIGTAAAASYRDRRPGS